MKIETRDVITLNDSNKYVVCSKVNYQGNNYLYLIDINNNKNIKFAKEKVQQKIFSIIEIEDTQLIQTLMPMFYSESKDILKEFIEYHS